MFNNIFFPFHIRIQTKRGIEEIRVGEDSGVVLYTKNTLQIVSHLSSQLLSLFHKPILSLSLSLPRFFPQIIHSFILLLLLHQIFDSLLVIARRRWATKLNLPTRKCSSFDSLPISITTSSQQLLLMMMMMILLNECL